MVTLNKYSHNTVVPDLKKNKQNKKKLSVEISAVIFNYSPKQLLREAKAIYTNSVNYSP